MHGRRAPSSTKAHLPSADGAAAEDAGRYGPIALFVGGTGEVRFKSLSLKDLNNRGIPAEATSTRFRMQRLDEFYYSWSAAVADVNRDGIMTADRAYYYWARITRRRKKFISRRATTRQPSTRADAW